MDEYVKAIKVVHQLLILASSTVLAFALTPDVEARYDKADKVLGFLQSCTADSWNDYVKRQVPNWETDTAKLQQFVNWLDPGAPRVRLVPFAYGNLHFPLNLSLLSVSHELERKQKLQTLQPHFDLPSLKRKWNDSMVVANASSPSNAIAVTPATETPRLRVNSVILTSPTGGGTSQSDTIGVMPLQSKTLDNSLVLYVNFAPGTAPKGIVIPSYDIRASVSEVIEKPFAMAWLREQDPDQKFLKSSTDAKELFAALDPFMGVLGGLDVNNARLKLQTDRESNHGKLSMFGISVAADSTVEVMPWITSGVLLFFLAHLRQFRQSINIGEKTGIPWIGFFDDTAGRLIAFGTVLMPVGANVLLIIRHGRPENTTIQTLALMVVTLCSTWSFAELWRTRAKIGPRNSQWDAL